VGAFIAGLIAFLLFRRKQQPVYHQQHAPYDGAGYTGQEKPGVIVTNAAVGGGAVDRLLPQPAEDGAVIGGLSSIRDSIKNHVQNYYHNAPVSPEMIDEASLVEMAHATAMTTGSIRNLLLNPMTRVSMIRLYLSHLVLSRCLGWHDAAQSFLPDEVSSFVASPSASSASGSKIKSP
jgi:hypothetical protein